MVNTFEGTLSMKIRAILVAYIIVFMHSKRYRSSITNHDVGKHDDRWRADVRPLMVIASDPS